MAIFIKTDNLADVKDEKIFFDANIWMYIFCEIGNYNNNLTKKYSTSFSYFLKNKTSIFIDITVISEFVNRYLRIAYSNYIRTNNLNNKDYDYKKDYRVSDDFKEAWENVCNIVNNRILLTSTPINFEYDRTSITALLDSNNNDSDFNDNHITNLCRTKDMYLFTHDRDFKNSGINIITENRHYWTN